MYKYISLEFILQEKRTEDKIDKLKEREDNWIARTIFVWFIGVHLLENEIDMQGIAMKIMEVNC